MAQILTGEQARFLADNGLVRVPRLRDPDLPHQPLMLLVQGSQHLAVSCNCMRTRGDGRSLKGSGYEPIEARACWQPGEAIARWREHLDGTEATA